MISSSSGGSSITTSVKVMSDLPFDGELGLRDVDDDVAVEAVAEEEDIRLVIVGRNAGNTPVDATRCMS